MLFHLICTILSTSAHLTSVGKTGNKMNSPETYVNLGQLQITKDNKMNSMHSGSAPMFETCKMGRCEGRIMSAPTMENCSKIGECSTRIAIAPMTETCKMGKCSGRMMMIVNTPSTIPNQIMNYGNIQAELMPMWMGDMMAMPQMIASPKLNFKVEQIGNVGQKGNF